MKNNNIVLISLMGGGKTTVAKAISQKYGFRFVDFDKEIECEECLSICDFFEKFGEEHFRALEKMKIKEYQNVENCVISTGGGIIKDTENIKILKNIGTVFYLYASTDVLYERIKDDKTRPLLNCEDPKGELEKIYEERKASYEMADFKINTENKSVDEIVQEIYEKIECKI
jgi:shikimate kinase